MTKIKNDRLLSLDTFRGMAMFMVLIEYAHLNYILTAGANVPIVGSLVNQLHHHAWNGLRFWDIGQPYFMFIIGVAMSISFSKRWARGNSWLKSFQHICYRCLILFLLGIVLQINIRDRMTFELWNILTTLSTSIFLSFLILKFRSSTQFIISVCVLIIYEALFRLFPVDGFDQPFVKHHNLGTYIDLMLMGKTHPDGWIAIGSIPLTAHVIWGVLTGKLLITSFNENQKLKVLITTGITGIMLGYGMDVAGLSPINKHICTSSFVIVSGGICLVTFAILYWLIDIKGYKRWTLIFTVVGMNPIFIYIFSSTIGRKWLNSFLAIFVESSLGKVTDITVIIDGISALLTIAFEWYLCYWLYKKKILIKI
jgi:predicted acyltransferase